MATALTYELKLLNIPKYQRIISYGKCTETPNIQSQLWFVTLRHVDNEDGTKVDNTFLVQDVHAKPSVFDEWGRDTKKWYTVAHGIFEGDWCVRHEILYKDLPVYEYSLSILQKIRYAYCKTTNIGDLWYVAFESGDTHLVKEEHANPDFFERVGPNQYKWLLISLGGNFGSYGYYEALVHGNLSPNLLNKFEGPLRGRKKTFNTEAALEAYEAIVLKYQEKNKKGPVWYELAQDEHEYWIKQLQDSDVELIPTAKSADGMADSVN